jgi:hypothetical protein
MAARKKKAGPWKTIKWKRWDSYFKKFNFNCQENSCPASGIFYAWHSGYSFLPMTYQHSNDYDEITHPSTVKHVKLATCQREANSRVIRIVLIYI